MKVEIDLSEIFEGEDGERISVSLSDRIQAAIVEKAKKSVSDPVRETFEKEMSKQIPVIVYEQISLIMKDLLDQEFTPIGNYGSRGQPTTLRNKIIKDIEEAMAWREARYDSDRNVYTKTINTVVEQNLKVFASKFNATVDEKFIAERMQYAVDNLKRVNGLK